MTGMFKRREKGFIDTGKAIRKIIEQVELTGKYKIREKGTIDAGKRD